MTFLDVFEGVDSESAIISFLTKLKGGGVSESSTRKIPFEKGGRPVWWSGRKSQNTTAVMKLSRNVADIRTFMAILV